MYNKKYTYCMQYTYDSIFPNYSFHNIRIYHKFEMNRIQELLILIRL